MTKAKRRDHPAQQRASFLEGDGPLAPPVGRRGPKSKAARRAAAKRSTGRRGMAEAGGPPPLDYRLKHPALDDGRPALERFGRQIPDSEGRPGNPHRVYDTLAALHRNGSIDDPALDAGRRFEEDFRLAALNNLHARNLARISGGGGRDLNDAMLAGRERVARAIKALGGHASPAGAALWAVLGTGQTIKEFAQSSQLGAGRSLDQKVAKGIVVAALSALAAHYGYDS